MILLSPLGGQAADRPAYRPRPKPALVSTAPVTQAEARATFFRVQRSLDQAIGLTGKVYQCGSPMKAEPITGFEAGQELTKLALRYEPKFRVAPPMPPKSDLASKLRTYRIFSPTGPIALGVKTLNPAEFGDAIGYFLVRMADLTHTPRKAYSPSIMGNG